MNYSPIALTLSSGAAGLALDWGIPHPSALFWVEEWVLALATGATSPLTVPAHPCR
jgi:hypothetical protein